VSVNDCEPLKEGCALSVALTVNVNGPAAVGVPDKDPVPASVSPGGSAPRVMLQEKGGDPPLATLNQNTP
jgi:hypothetical protein